MRAAADSESQSAHKLALARELVDNIELSTLRPEQLLLKASRLARLIADDQAIHWLRFELIGYPKDHPVALDFLTKTGRWTDREEGKAYRESWVQIDALIASKERESRKSYQELAEAYNNLRGGDDPTADGADLGTLRRIGSLILFWLHRFVSAQYHALAFSGLAEAIFEKHKQMVDALLHKIAGEVLEKMPAIYDRLAIGDPEAISQALTTGRRVLAAFADAVQSPQTEKLSLDGKAVDATGDKYMNRLRYFITTNCASDHRKERLRDTVDHLYRGFNAAVHADVTLDEARALFVLLYVTLVLLR